MNEIDFLKQQFVNIPTLKDLDKKQIEQIAKIVCLDNLKKEMEKHIKASNYDYKELKDLFISTLTNFTKKTYSTAFENFEDFLKISKIENPLLLTIKQADDYINYLLKLNYSSKSVKTKTGPISSFFTFVEKKSGYEIESPFHHKLTTVKITPTKKNKFYNFGVDENVIKTVEKDFMTIIRNTKNKELRASIFMSMKLGFRVGAYESMEILGNRFKTVSKGKDIIGVLPLEVLNLLKLYKITSFKKSTESLKNSFWYLAKKLYKENKISFPYSFHDIRHYYAIKTYLKTNDIYKVSKLLNHSSIAMTEVYMRGFNIIEDVKVA